MMMSPWSDWPVGRRLAAAVLITGVSWDVLALVRLARNDVDTPASPLAMPTPPSLARRALDDPRLFVLAAARAPFDGGVTLPSAEAASQPFAAAAAQPRLTGTVVQGTGSFVVIERMDGSMRLLHVGERSDGLALRSVTPGAAVFEDSTGHRIVLHAASPETAARP